MNFGWKRDPRDDRDHDAVKRYLKALPVPAAADNSDLVKIVDQGQLGSCTANAAGQAVRAMQILEGVVNPAFWARLFPYYLARGFDHTTKDDAGTNIRTIFKAVDEFGFPDESAWPYNDNTDPLLGPTPFSQMPPADVFRQAFDRRTTDGTLNYARITETGYARVDAVKLASSQRHLIVFGTDVSKPFAADMTANGGKPIDPPTASTPIAGGHAMCIGRYDAQGAGIINSWSEQYGQAGWCKFSWDYIAWENTTDLWIVKRAPQ